MKVLLFIALFILEGLPNNPVEKVDLKRYAGKWYSLYSIPTLFDKGSRETTTYYTWNRKGYFDVLTKYKKPDSETVHSTNSKVFQVAGTNNAEMKAQFIWPYKVDYWVVELAEDYSYVVVGHPQKKFLFIMSRQKTLDKKLLQDITKRCKEKGYEVNKLVSQQHND
ncbi:MAG: lipocalin family protein [Pyrinomonadaceae bacterium]|nr:lipocalin family protein [Sphingobacteriaceae bacterium]